jgi:hypothetical protein
VTLDETHNEWLDAKDDNDNAVDETSKSQPEEEAFDYDSENSATQDGVSESPDVADWETSENMSMVKNMVIMH